MTGSVYRQSSFQQKKKNLILNNHCVINNLGARMLNIQLFLRLILNKIKMDLCTYMRQRSHCDSKVFVYFSSLKFDKAENHHFLFSHWYTWTQAFVLLFFLTTPTEYNWNNGSVFYCHHSLVVYPKYHNLYVCPI